MRVCSLVAVILLFGADLTPDASRAQNIVEGRKAWLRLNCYGCHGDNGEGARAPRVIGQDATNIRKAMLGTKGASGMRSYLGVSEVRPTDFADMAAYLLTVGTPQEPKWHDWWRRR